MLRGIVLLLTALPMLMPPGICVCQFAHRSGNSNDSAQTTSATTLSATRCCKCSTHNDFENFSDAGTTFANHSPSPEDPKHDPGCPAVLGTTPNKIVLASVVMPSEFGVATAILELVPSKAATFGRFQSDSITHSDPPLFLTYCTLVL